MFVVCNGGCSHHKLQFVSHRYSHIMPEVKHCSGAIPRMRHLSDIVIVMSIVRIRKLGLTTTTNHQHHHHRSVLQEQSKGRKVKARLHTSKSYSNMCILCNFSLSFLTKKYIHEPRLWLIRRQNPGFFSSFFNSFP